MSSFESPKMRWRKSETIRGRPFRRDTVGSQPRRSLALEMSGFLLCGSSSVFGLNSILAFGSIVSCTTYIYITLLVRKKVIVNILIRTIRKILNASRVTPIFMLITQIFNLWVDMWQLFYWYRIIWIVSKINLRIYIQSGLYYIIISMSFYHNLSL